MDDRQTGTASATNWWRLLNRYQWTIFAFAAMGWMFDTMDQQIFTASRSLAMKTLLPGQEFATQTRYGTWVTALFILGWATGGLLFGVMGDKWGRVKTMASTIIIYSLFTGLSALATNYWMFAVGRFLTGFGVGGEFAVGAALVAEVMPEKARPHALGMLQALSAVGNIIGAKLLGVVVPHWGWQGLYWVGTFPAIVGLVVFWRLREPEKFEAAKAAAKAGVAGQSMAQFGRMSDLFRIPRWRKHTFVGLALAVAGVLGLWGAGFWSPELIDSTLPTLSHEVSAKYETVLAAEGPAQAVAFANLAPAEQRLFQDLRRRVLGRGEGLPSETAQAFPLSAGQAGRLKALLAKGMPENEKTRLKSNALVLQQVGAFVGIYAFGLVAGRMGRRPAFLIALLLGWASVALTFGCFSDRSQIWYLWPLLGFGTLAVFGGYAIYFPELFPTRLRSTGTGFCYNVGRYIAAFGPLTLGQLALVFEGHFEVPGFRLAAMVIACAYFIGIVALLWAPETLNQPLPEDEPPATPARQ